jgi:DNA-binding response OmpR family regulator
MDRLEVLIVEDEPLIAGLFADIMEEMGHHVCAVESTEAGAVAAALKWQPHLMIVDAGLARGSGIVAVQTILQADFVPHIFVSGERLAGSDLDSRAIVLQKPFRESDMAAAIDRALGGRPAPPTEDR